MRRVHPAVRPFLPFVVVAGALGALGLVGLLGVVRGDPRAAGPAPRIAPGDPRGAVPSTPAPDPASPDDDPAAAAALRGLWSRFPDVEARDDAPVAFYYFHTDGIGLFRYGRIAHNTTNSFHWRLVGDTLELRWNKTGVVDRLDYHVDRRGPRPVLVLPHDPKNPGAAASRYTFVPAPQADPAAADLAVAHGPTLSADHGTLDRVDNRLWMDLKQFATGGMGFSLYQLRSQGIDGRGTGWHHVGDFDDWSTEQLTFKATSTGPGRAQLDLVFALRAERATTTVAVGRHVDHRGQPQRTLTLQQDPRDFGAVHTYVDAGPSFAGLALVAPSGLPLAQTSAAGPAVPAGGR